MTTLDPTLLRWIRKLADEIVTAANRPITNAPKFSIEWAVVVSIQPGPPATATVNVAGSSTAIPNVRFLGSYAPHVNDLVMCAWQGSDLFILDKVAVTQTGLVIPHTWAPLTTVAAGTPTTYWPGMFVPAPGSQTATLIGLAYVTNPWDGGSFTFTMYDNGLPIPDTRYQNLTVTTTQTVTWFNEGMSTGYALSADDFIFPFVESVVSGTPKNPTITAYIEYGV